LKKRAWLIISEDIVPYIIYQLISLHKFNKCFCFIYELWKKCKILCSASSALRELTWASNLFETHIGIIGPFKPVESPLAASLQLRWQLITFSNTPDSTITSTPSIVRCTPLTGTSVEDAYSSARNLEIKVIGSQILSAICNLIWIFLKKIH